MRKLFTISLLVPILVFITISIGTAEDWTCISYQTENGDFNTKFWKEKYFGGDDGDVGNVVMAVGQGFILQGLTLTIPPTAGPPYTTIYEGGTLILNSSGPWLPMLPWLPQRKLKATGIEATNISHVDGDPALDFQLIINSVELEGTDCSLTVIVDYNAADDPKYKKKEGVFQKGNSFHALVEICCPDP